MVTHVLEQKFASYFLQSVRLFNKAINRCCCPLSRNEVLKIFVVVIVGLLPSGKAFWVMSHESLVQ
jgi:hypothetical protein